MLSILRYIGHFDNDELIITNHVNDYFTTTDLEAFINSLSHTNDSGQHNSSTKSVDLVLEDVQCNRYTPHVININRSGIDQYLKEIKNKSQFDEIETRSYYFTQSYFIHQTLADQIFSKLEQALKEIDLETIFGDDTSSVSLYLNVTDYDRPIDSGPHPFSVTINSHRELRYAINLLKVYKTYLKPYLEENSVYFLNQTKDFDRFFVFVGDLNSYALGKTLHNTRATFDMTIHLLEHYLDSNISRPQLQRGFEPRIYFIPNDLARLSHFRKVLNFSYKEIPFENFIFDVNYFNCYFKPIIDKLIKEES